MCRFGFRATLARILADTGEEGQNNNTHGLRSQELLNYTVPCVITVPSLCLLSTGSHCLPGCGPQKLMVCQTFSVFSKVLWPSQWGDLAESGIKAFECSGHSRQPTPYPKATFSYFLSKQNDHFCVAWLLNEERGTVSLPYRLMFI